MRIKALKTIVYHSQIFGIGSETEMPEDAVKAFGEEYVEVLGGAEPDKAGPAETKEPENQEQGTESAEPDKAERKKSKKK